MEREVTELTIEELNELEDERIQGLTEAGIDEREVLAKVKDCQDIFQGYFSENITRGKADMNFAIRDQWTAVERSEFQRTQKIPLVFNKLYDPVKKIAGEQRKNKPDLIVRSLTGKASQEQIDLRADLVRTIAYQSQNDLIYQQAFMSAMLMGYGAFQIELDFETPKSFNQVIRYRMVNDATRVSFDPTAEKPHKGDGNWCSRNFIFSKEEFTATYPHIYNPVSYIDQRSLLDFQWETRDTIVVSDFYMKEWYPVIVYGLSNGTSVTWDEWEAMQPKIKLLNEMADGSPLVMQEIPKIIRERQSQDYRIRQYRCIQNQIIEFSEWPSKYLPIIFVDGDSQFIEGRQYTKSFIHDAKDAQRFINFVGSEVATEIKNRRREQWIGTPDNIIDNEQMWRNPEVQMGILMAKPDPKTGQLPQKMPQWELSQSLLSQYERGTMDIKEILGFHEELSGAETNAQSGRAVMMRQRAGSMAAYIQQDNLNQSIEQGGRVVLDLLPYVIGQDERHMVITKQDGKTQSIILNKKIGEEKVENEISAGDYDIEIDTGPSFAVQKETSVNLLLQLCQTNPQIFPLVADLIAKNLDVQFMPQIVERLRNLVPPQILAKEEGKEMPPQPPNPQEQMMQMQSKLAEAQLQERAQELKIRQEKHQLEKAQLYFDAIKMEDELKAKKEDRHVETQKHELDYSAKIAKILGDLHR